MYFDWLNFSSDGAGSDKGHKFHGSTAHEIGDSDSKFGPVRWMSRRTRTTRVSLADARQGDCG